MSERKRFVVKAATVEEAVAELPSLTDWSGSIGEEAHLLVVPRGFEERVCAFPRVFADKGIKIHGPIVVGHYRTNQADNDRRAEELDPLLGVIATQAHIGCDADTPSAIQEAINCALRELPSTLRCHVLFDISAASSTFILSVLLTLLAANRPIKLTVLYATALKYHAPPEDSRNKPPMQWAEDSLREQGVSEVSTNELQTGFHHDHLPGFAIVIPSMFGNRLTRCLGHLGLDSHDSDEDEIYWLLPSTESEEHQWRHDAVMRAVLDIVYSADASAPATLPEGAFGECGALDYKECARLVMREIERRAGTNISMIHMGTKLQALGVALALAARPEVALVHARPQAFAAQTYSQGIGALRQVVFEDLRSDLQRLSSVGTLQVAAC